MKTLAVAQGQPFEQRLSCTRRIQFCAGHRVVGHEGKCKNAHGHNYVALIHARAVRLDSVGRVIDFSVLKETIGGFIEEFWDHKFIVWKDDLDLRAALNRAELPYFVLEDNPTAENMARYLLRNASYLIPPHYPIEVFKVTLWETENCYAEVEL